MLPRFYHWWDVKPRGGGEISFIFRGLRFHLRFMDLKLTPSSIIFILFFYLPVKWQEVTKRFPTIRLGVRGRLPGKRPLQAV